MEGGKKEYQPLIIPKLSWDKKNISETYGELVAQPLEPGFGNTLGNAIRRALLGAVEGSAVTSVIIKGINNEFSSIPGVVFPDVKEGLLKTAERMLWYDGRVCSSAGAVGLLTSPAAFWRITHDIEGGGDTINHGN